MRHRPMQRLAYAGVCILAATGFTVFVAAAPASASTCGTSHVPSDFNGDGIADAAISDAPANGVLILYGTRSGLTVAANGTAPATKTLTVNANTDMGVPFTLVTADFNGDGCADLAVGDYYTLDHVGLVEIYYGSPTGLSSTGYIITASTVTGVSRTDYDNFGVSLAAGDFNHDGYPDLVVGAWGNFNADGRVFIFPGSPIYLPGAGGSGRVFTEGDGTIPGVAETNDFFGISLAAGDFNGDGTTDLAIGVPGEDSSEGCVIVMRGSGTSSLLTATGAKIWTQDSTDILGVAEPGDRFGTALATADFKGNGRTDLAIGVPGEEVSGIFDAGAVNVIYSAGTAGLSSTGNQLWDQRSLGYSTAYSYYGTALATGDFDGDGKTDLAIGAPGAQTDNDATSGSVQILTGATGGLVGSIGELWDRSSPGIPGSPVDNDRFGAALTGLQTSAAGRADLLIGVPGVYTATVNGDEYNGEVEFLFSSSTGITGTGAQMFKCETPGLLGGCDYGNLGSAVA